MKQPHCLWFYPDTPASSITKTGRHDIDDILLKVTLSTTNQSINHMKQCVVRTGITCGNLKKNILICKYDIKYMIIIWITLRFCG